MKSIGKSERGFTLLEVLITIVILAFALLGLTSLQTKLHMSQMESYQRALAVVLMQDMANRIQASSPNLTLPADFDDYLTDWDGDDTLETGEWMGTGSTKDCSAPVTRADTDLCDWHTQLRGISETGVNVTEFGARGCVEEIQAPNNAAGVCLPGVYRVSVAWQGLYTTTAPSLTCSAGEYGADEALRRIVSTTVSVGHFGCL